MVIQGNLYGAVEILFLQIEFIGACLTTAATLLTSNARLNVGNMGCKALTVKYVQVALVVQARILAFHTCDAAQEPMPTLFGVRLLLLAGTAGGRLSVLRLISNFGTGRRFFSSDGRCQKQQYKENGYPSALHHERRKDREQQFATIFAELVQFSAVPMEAALTWNDAVSYHNSAPPGRRAGKLPAWLQQRAD